MAIHSFCHLEEPVPQNNDLKKAHLLAKKSLHLGSSSDGAKRCFVKFRSLTFSGMRISEQTDYWGLPGYSSETILVGVGCLSEVPKLECKASRVLMMDINGYLQDNNGCSIFKSSFILVGDKIWPSKCYALISVPKRKTQISNCNVRAYYVSLAAPAKYEC